MNVDLLNMRIQGNKLYIGESPVLVVDLKTQKNYIHYENEDIPFKKRFDSARTSCMENDQMF